MHNIVHSHTRNTYTNLTLAHALISYKNALNTYTHTHAIQIHRCVFLARRSFPLALSRCLLEESLEVLKIWVASYTFLSRRRRVCGRLPRKTTPRFYSTPLPLPACTCKHPLTLWQLYAMVFVTIQSFNQSNNTSNRFILYMH
jgi:hypothetical protein